MIVYGFADSINWAMNTLTGDNYRVLNYSGTWVPQRAPALAQVSGADGAFDFFKSNDFPNQPTTVSVNGLLFHTSQANAYTQARLLIDTYGTSTRYSADRSRLWFVKPESYKSHIAPLKNQVRYNVSGAVARGGNPTAARVYAVSGSDYVAWAATDVNGNYSISVPPGSYTMMAEEWIDLLLDGVYWPTTTYFTGTANTTVTTANVVGVNIDITSNSLAFPYRWAWAKCTSARVVPAPSTVSWAPIEADFSLSEGVLYSTVSSSTRDEGDATTFNLTYSGTRYAPVRFDITANANAISQVVLTNNTNGSTFTWAGTLAATKTLVVNAMTYSVTNDGANAYSGLTCNNLPWISIGPAATNSFTITVTQAVGANYDFNIYWLNTFGL